MEVPERVSIRNIDFYDKEVHFGLFIKGMEYTKNIRKVKGVNEGVVF